MIKEEDVELWATDRGLALKFKSLIRFATDQIFWRWTMNNRPPPLPIDRNWKTLYRAAIFETNRNAIPERVSKAEKAVVARARELFGQAGTLEEKEALEDALYALRAFRTAWQHTAAA